MASEVESVGLRYLGPLETFYQLLIDRYNASHYMHIVVVGSSVRLSPEDVKKAFVALSEHYEALRLRVVPRKNKDVSFRFEQMKAPTVDLSLINISKKSDWPSLLTDKNQTKIDCLNGPLWNVVLAHIEDTEESANHDSMPHQCLLIVKLHHAIADAKSMTDVMHRYFMPVLSAVVNEEPIKGLIPEVPLQKSLEELFASKPFDGNRYRLPWILKLLFDVIRWKNKTFGNHEFKDHLSYPYEEIPAEEKIPELPPCQPILFDKEHSSSIIRAAKRNGVTVHCVFLAVTSIAVCKTAEEAGVKLPMFIKQQSPVDLRKYLNWKSPQPLGAYTNIFETVTRNQTEYSVKEFWKTCKNIHKEVKQKSSKENSTALLGVTQYFVDGASHTDLMQIFDELGMSCICSVSNPGVCDLGTPPVLSKGKVKVDLTEQYFTVTGLRRMNSTPLGNLVLTYRGKIAWNVAYNEAKVSRRFVEEYIKNLKGIFWKYCGETPV